MRIPVVSNRGTRVFRVTPADRPLDSDAATYTAGKGIEHARFDPRMPVREAIKVSDHVPNCLGRTTELDGHREFEHRLSPMPEPGFILMQWRAAKLAAARGSWPRWSSTLVDDLIRPPHQ